MMLVGHERLGTSQLEDCVTAEIRCGEVNDIGVNTLGE